MPDEKPKTEPFVGYCPLSMAAPNMRACVSTCKAFNEKDSTCKLISGISGLNKNIRTMTRWLSHHDPPKV